MKNPIRAALASEPVDAVLPTGAVAAATRVGGGDRP